MSEIFNSFKKASSFAKSQSIELGVLHKIIKIDNKWAVLSKNEKFIRKEPTKVEIDLRKKVRALEERIEGFENAQRREEERAERERKEKEIKEYQKRKEKELKAEQERKDYLQSQKETYLSSSAEKLTELSLSYLADDLSLEDDEYQILLPILQPYLKSIRDKAEKEKLNYLNERKEYYLSLPEAKLDELWLESEILIETEKNLLRSILRHKKGYGSEIKREYVPEFCASCNMTTEVCNCKERSWW